MRTNCLANLLFMLALVLGGTLVGLDSIIPGQLAMESTPTDSAVWATINAAPEVIYSPCDPVVEGIIWGEEPDLDISMRLAAIYDADQASRTVPEPDWSQIMQGDQANQVEVMEYLQAGQIVTVRDLYHAAMIFQHGDCPEHYQLAQELARRAMDKGSTSAKWLYAAATDRYLMSIDQPQLYGTQARCFSNTGCFLWPVDPSITDAERARYNVPPLAERLAQIEEMNETFPSTSP